MDVNRTNRVNRLASSSFNIGRDSQRNRGRDSQQNKPKQNKSQQSMKQGMTQGYGNKQGIRDMLNSMSEGEQANYFAKQYHEEFGEIPTSFEHTYEGDTIELTDADLENLEEQESALEL